MPKKKKKRLVRVVSPKNEPYHAFYGYGSPWNWTYGPVHYDLDNTGKEEPVMDSETGYDYGGSYDAGGADIGAFAGGSDGGGE